MNTSDKQNKWFSTFFQFGFLLLSLVSSIIIISILVINQKSMEERITTLEYTLQEQLVKQTELLLDIKMTKADDNQINQDNIRIQEINAVYSNLLTEQQKRTHNSLSTQQVRNSLSLQKQRDSLYTQEALLEIEQDAIRLFQEGKYAMAYFRFSVVAQEQPENTDARFFQLYSLFLNNKLDRNNYRQIKEGLEALELYGYYRMETKEILKYIASEEDELISNTGDIK